MQKKYIGKDDPLALRKNKVYDVISIEHGWYRIVDETNEDYLYPPQFFVETDEDDSLELDVCNYVVSLVQVDDENDWATPTLKEYPFWREGMSSLEYENERIYYYKHFKDVENGTYKPLWKQ